jgi:hypothetical protein
MKPVRTWLGHVDDRIKGPHELVGNAAPTAFATLKYEILIGPLSGPEQTVPGDEDFLRTDPHLSRMRRSRPKVQ